MQDEDPRATGQVVVCPEFFRPVWLGERNEGVRTVLTGGAEHDAPGDTERGDNAEDPPEGVPNRDCLRDDLQSEHYQGAQSSDQEVHQQGHNLGA